MSVALAAACDTGVPPTDPAEGGGGVGGGSPSCGCDQNVGACDDLDPTPGTQSAEPCPCDEECGGGTGCGCDQNVGACDDLDPTPGTQSNEPCPCDEECGGGTDCPAGEVEDANGECRRPECSSTADCYDQKAYCADNFCYGVETCDRGGPAMGDSGPLLFGAVQVDLNEGTNFCSKDAAACTNNGNVCGWNVFFFDPDGDFPATKGALYGKTKFIEADGRPVAAFNVDAPDMASSTATLYSCHDEAKTAVDAGFQILDAAGNPSNVICVSGDAP